MKKGLLLKYLAFAGATAVCFAGVYGSFAYFKAVEQSAVSLETNVSESKVTRIGNFYDLYRYTKATAYNDSEKTSDVEGRTTLVLDGNLSLQEDLYVSADVHLNLNGKTLDLNGHSLIFQHGYYGSLVVENGTVNSTGGGEVVVDTPHASYVFDNVTYDISAVKIVETDEVLTAYNAFYEVANVLVNHTDERKERLTLAELNAKGGFTLSDLLNLKHECVFSGKAENCVFVDRDVDLPYHYFSEDVTIEYLSSNEAILDSYGNLLTMPESSANVNLTVKVSYKEEWSRTLVIPIHVVNTGNKDTAAMLGKELIKSYLQKYWVESGKMISYAGTDLFDQYYLFTSGIDLPTEDVDFDLQYSYKVKDYRKDEAETISKVKDSVFRFEPNEKCFYLETTVKDRSGNTSSFDLPIYCTYVTDEETVLRLMMNDLYGGSIIYDASLPSKHLYSMDEIKGEKSSDLSPALLAQLREYIEQYGITNVEYTMIEDVAEHYVFENSNLIAKDDISQYKENGVRVTATFADGTSMGIDLYVIYLTGNGDTVAGYWTYYNHYNETYVPAELSESFRMPFAYSMDDRNYSIPYTVYDVAYGYKIGNTQIDEVDTAVYYSGENEQSGLTFAKPDGLTIRLVEDDTVYVSLRYGGYSTNNGATWVNVADRSSLSASFNAYLAASGHSLADLKKAQWEFAINAPGLSFEDLDLAILYNYSFIDNGASTKWLPYVAGVGAQTYYTNLTTSTVKMEGGLVCAAGNTANHVPDNNLFVWMYNGLNPSGETITTGDNLTEKYIRNDWLASDLPIDAANSAPGNVTNWYGIQFMDATTSVDLSGVTVTNDIMNYITGVTPVEGASMGMDNVEKLYLNNCGLTQALVGDKFRNMEHLKTLSIANNGIAMFETAVLDIPALETVYLYGNTVANSNGYLGSEGISNFQTYEDLKRKGVSVYYKMNNNNTPILFENSDERNDYQRLKNLEYQSVLSSTQSIETLYEDFRNLRVADLNVSGNITGWGYEPGKTVYTATYFYVTVNNNGAILTVKYYVDRY